MTNKEALSIVVPTLNEAGNMRNLVQRIDTALSSENIPYELIVVDDHSSDDTALITEELSTLYPVRLSLKRGKRGKAFSLIQGFAEARHDLVLMIDADLQYPPEEIVPMYRLLQSKNADIVTTRRQVADVSLLRKLSSKIYNLIFAKLLFGIDFDTQSGQKLFRKRILNHFKMNPSPWSFDLEFLVRALENKHKIISHDIVFAQRQAGLTKIKIFSSTIELALAAIKLRFRTSAPKIREGHESNIRFLKRAFPVAIITLGFLAALFVASPNRVSAQGLPNIDIAPTSLLNNLLEPPGTNSNNTFTQPQANNQSKPVLTPGPDSNTIAPPHQSPPTENKGASPSSINSKTADNNKKTVSGNLNNKPIDSIKNPDTGSSKPHFSSGFPMPAKRTFGSFYTLADNPANPLVVRTLNSLMVIAWLAGAACVIAYGTFVIPIRKHRLQ